MSRSYKCRMENRDELSALLKMDDLHIDKLSMRTLPDEGEIEVTIFSNNTMSEIREIMEEIEGDLMIETLNHSDGYTGERWYIIHDDDD